MKQHKRDGQRGSAMMVTLIVTSSLLAGAAVVASMQLSTNRSTDVTRSGMTALYCAEAGLEAAGPLIAGAPGAWGPNLCAVTGINEQELTSHVPAGCMPTSLADENARYPIFIPVNHDLDGDGREDFLLYMHDDDDDVDYTTDANIQIYLVSTCVKFPDTPKQVKELITFTGGGSCGYNSQLGGCGGNGNAN